MRVEFLTVLSLVEFIVNDLKRFTNSTFSFIW